MPASAVLLVILGLGPFIGCGLAALDPHVATADRMLTGLIAWGALVLRESEAGPAVPPGGRGIGRHTHIGLAVLPLILGWVAVMLPLVAAAWLALLLLIVAYIAAILAEHHAARQFVLPARYLWLRWGFTVVAVAMLTTVLTLRLLGQTIVL